MLAMAEANAKRSGYFAYWPVASWLMAYAAGCNIAISGFGPRTMTLVARHMRVKAGRNRKRDTAT